MLFLFGGLTLFSFLISVNFMQCHFDVVSPYNGCCAPQGFHTKLFSLYPVMSHCDYDHKFRMALSKWVVFTYTHIHTHIYIDERVSDCSWCVACGWQCWLLLQHICDYYYYCTYCVCVCTCSYLLCTKYIYNSSNSCFAHLSNDAMLIHSLTHSPFTLPLSRSHTLTLSWCCKCSIPKHMAGGRVVFAYNMAKDYVISRGWYGLEEGRWLV